MDVTLGLGGRGGSPQDTPPTSTPAQLDVSGGGEDGESWCVCVYVRGEGVQSLPGRYIFVNRRVGGVREHDKEECVRRRERGGE